ncbi:hypothetical protein CCHL11_00719 [Colletotrichum chlorophyti]|uniref:Uncharacterized protein n=1 Tax=Colletotrichum chlorophyti TaxID=708187 RepID=A0A1Q8S592_9PEZI|nr:hypothetical protein CCHL11_00719 [Colletotrichum chlorophyti]
MSTAQTPSTQQPNYAPYPPPQPQYYVQQPRQQQQQPQVQHHQQPQYQPYQHYQNYQPPQQPQYYNPSPLQNHHEHNAAACPQTAAGGPTPPPQQHFLAELEAPQPTSSVPKPRPTSPSSSPSASVPTPAPAPVSDANAAVFEMSAEPAVTKPDPGTTTTSAPSPPIDAPHRSTYQANPWGFFLPDDPPPKPADSTQSGVPPPSNAALSVKPLRIVKTGPAKPDQGTDAPGRRASAHGRPQSAIVQDVTPQVQEAAQQPQSPPVADTLVPAPLNLSRPMQQQPTSPAAPASDLAYPLDGSTIPTPDTLPQPGAQITLPIHPGPVVSPMAPLSPALHTPSPLSPLQTGPPVTQQPTTQHAYTQPTPVSPIVVAALPPTLPMASYFPQQPSYVRPEPQASLSTHHSPSTSISSPTQEASQAQQQYASPPPTYTQAISQPQPATTSSQTHQYHHPPPGPVSPNPTGTQPFSPPAHSPYPYSPASIGADKLACHQNMTSPLQYPYNPLVPPPPHISGPSQYQPAPPLPPRNSPPAPGVPQAYAFYGPPPTRLNYTSPPPVQPKPDSRLFSTATARKLLNKTTELVDQTITPYLQDHRYRPPYNQYPYQYRPPPGPQAQYYQQAFAPSQRA